MISRHFDADEDSYRGFESRMSRKVHWQTGLMHMTCSHATIIVSVKVQSSEFRTQR